MGAGHFGHKTLRHRDTSATRHLGITKSVPNRVIATGVKIPPKSAQVNFLWGKNDVRTAIQQFYMPKKTYTPQNKFLAMPLVPKFKTNHQWSCVSSELSWVEVSRLFLDHGARVEVSRTTFLVSKCLEIGAEVSQSVLMPKCLVVEVSG